MAEPKSKWQVASDMFSFVGGVSGLVALLSVALAGGQYVRQLNVDTERITTIDNRGSSGFRAHVEAQAVRDATVSKSISNLEEQIRLNSEVRGDLRVINTKLEGIQKQLDAAATIALASSEAAKAAAAAATAAAEAAKAAAEAAKSTAAANSSTK